MQKYITANNLNIKKSGKGITKIKLLQSILKTIKPISNNTQKPTSKNKEKVVKNQKPPKTRKQPYKKKKENKKDAQKKTINSKTKGTRNKAETETKTQNKEDFPDNVINNPDECNTFEGERISIKKYIYFHKLVSFCLHAFYFCLLRCYAMGFNRKLWACHRLMVLGTSD